MKVSKGTARLEDYKGRLRVQLPRELFNGKQKYLSLGLPANREGYIEGERKLRGLQSDIDLGQFDNTLEKYKKQSQTKEYLTSVTTTPELTLKELWERYLAYKRFSLKETTIYKLESFISPLFNKLAGISINDALAVRAWLINNTTESTSKRMLQYINASFDWGVKYNLLKGNNPYKGMSAELSHKQKETTKAAAFTQQEKELIINSFNSHSVVSKNKGVNGYSYSHYTALVKFLFLTGCRPSEAIGLQWKDIINDCKVIIFDGSLYTTSGGKHIRTKGSKNNKRREFPCNEELQKLIKSIKPNNIVGDELVFISPNGKPINYHNFRERAWKVIVTPIKPNTTPYSCRDTFITEQVSKGIPIALIAKWVDNSVEMIEKSYLDSSSLRSILPM